MADLDIRVRLSGESGQLVGQLNAAAGAEDNVAAKAQGMAAAADRAAAATARQQREAASLSAALSRAEAAEAKAAAAAAQLERAQNQAALAALKLERAQAGTVRGLGQVRQAGQATGQGLQGLGLQFGDFATQVSLGSNVFQAFGAQAGQAAFAMQGMGGVAGRVGTFLAGPWGSLILAAVTITGVFASKLLEAGDAADKVQFASYGLRDAQSALGGVMDLTTGKIKNQTGALLALAQAQIIAGQVEARRQQASARTAMAEFTRPGTGGYARAPSLAEQQATGFRQQAVGRGLLSPEGQVLAQFQSGGLAIDKAERQLRSLMGTGKITEKAYLDAAKALTDYGVAGANLSAFQSAERLLNGGGTAADRKLLLTPKTESAGRTRKGSGDDGAAKAAQLAAFGERAEESVKRITEQFDAQPKLVDRVNQGVRQLDAIISDLNKKQPQGFKEMAAEAERAKGVVRAALLQPFNDYMQAQQQSADLDRLRLAGRDDEAEALRVIYQLERQVGEVTAGQRQAILDNVEAERLLNEQLAQRQEMVSAYTDVIRGARSDVESLLSGNLSGGDFLKNLGRNFRQLQGKLLTEQLFGPLFRDLEKTVQERTGIQSSVDIFKRGSESAGKAGDTMADSLEKAAGRVDKLFGGTALGGSTAGNAPSAGVLGAVQAGREIMDPTGLGGEWDALLEGLKGIEVAGDKPGKPPTVMSLPPGQFARLLSDVLTAPLLRGLTQLVGPGLAGRIQAVAGGALAGYARGGIPGGILGGLAEIKPLSDAVDKLFKTSGVLKGAVEGAATGTAVAGLTKALGLKTSTTGAQIGGAIGSALPIPGGEIIGSLAGGLIGGLFKKSKSGSASLTGSGDPTLSGNSAKFKGVASGLAGSVQQGLQSIVDQLGGQLGDFAVSIGVRDGKFRVDPTGKGATKKSRGAQDFGDNEDAAVAAAIADAIKDGAIQGISAAQQKALQAFGDASKGLTEALKVRQLEVALGGLTGAALEAFRQFEVQAKDRVRIATAYGLEVNKVEELNARERVKLRAQLERESFGSLQDLLTRLRTGDLFEGSAVDQRNALLGQIETVRGQAAAGEEGAADKLASLLEQLNSVSKDVFGTAGGFAADRSQIESTAESVIGLLRTKLDEAAAQVANPQLDTTNALLDENADQNAQMIAALQRIASGVEGGAFGAGGGGGDILSSVAALAYTGRTPVPLSATGGFS